MRFSPARIPACILWSILGITPVFFWPKTHLISELPKVLLFEAATLVLVGAMVLIWAYRGMTAPAQCSRWGRFLVGSLAAFFIIAGLSTLFSIAPHTSLWGLYYRFQGFFHLLFLALFFAASFFLSRNASFLSRAAQIIVLGSIPICLYALLQWGGIDPVFGHLDPTQFFGRIFSLMGNPNYLAQYLVFLLPLTVYFFVKSQGVARRLFAILFLLQTGVLLLTQSRAGQLGAFVALGALFLFLMFAKKSRRAFVGFMLLILAPIFVAAALFFADLKLPLFMRWLPSAEASGSIEARLALWGIAERAVRERPLLGFGPEMFVRVVSTYQTEPLPPYTGIPDRAHNIVLDMAVSYGVVGAVILLCATIIALMIAFRSGTLLSMTLGSSVLGLFIAYQFGFLTTVDGMLLLFALAGIAAQETQAVRKVAPLFSSLRRVLVSLIVIVGISVEIFYFQWLPFRADMLFKKGTVALAEHRPFPAMHFFDRAIAENPRQPFYAFQAAHRTIAYAETIAQTPERKQLLLRRAISFAERGLSLGGDPMEFRAIVTAHANALSSQRDESI